MEMTPALTTTNNNDAEVIDLAAELAKATQEKISVATPATTATGIDDNDDTAGDQSEGGENHDDDFDEPDPEKETSSTGAAAGIAGKLSYSPEKLAKTIVEGVETAVEMGFPYLYQQSLDKDDRLALKQLARKYRNTKNKKTVTLSEEDQRVMEIYLDYDEFTENLAFDADEKKSLAEPLAEVLKNMNYQTTPQNALIIAALIVIAPRLIPVGKNFLMK